ncbi:MAG TPA: hypothetical protein VMA09_17330 [Candidatus Binataceae bacterium]|nr:hypothetical protein [Candidatus Binataceae bacterium]
MADYDSAILVCKESASATKVLALAVTLLLIRASKKERGSDAPLVIESARIVLTWRW